MLDATLESSVFLERGKVLTPTLVAKAFDRAVLEVPHGWQAEAILRHTRFGTKGFPFRDQITPLAVRLAFNNAIEYVLPRSLRAAPNIVSHIADDKKLVSAISPKFIFDRVASYIDDGQLEFAIYNFEATELSPKHRKAFSFDDVANLYKKIDELGKFDLASILFKTTERMPKIRMKISPEDVRRTFLKCLAILEGSENQGKYQASQTAMDLLRYTIADRRFRETGGITQDDIERLKAYFVKITQSKAQYPWEESSHQAVVVWKANKDLDFITACTFNPEDVPSISLLCDQYKSALGKRYGNGGPQGWHEAKCIRALESYPTLKLKMSA